MRSQSAAAGTVEKKGWVTALWMARRGAQTDPVAICISGVRGASLCPEQALFSLRFPVMHRGLKGCKAGMTMAPRDTAE